MSAHDRWCPCRVCKRPIVPVRIGEMDRWGHAEPRRGGDKHRATPPRLTESELRALWGDR